MKNHFTMILVIVGLFLVGAACKKSADNAHSSATTTTNTRTNQAVHTSNSNVNGNQNATVLNDNTNRQTNSASNSNRNTNTSVNSNNNTNQNSVFSNTLTVSNPSKNEQIESSFTVEGKAGSATVYVRVKNAAGTTMFTVPATVRNGQFKITLSFEFTNTTSGTIEAFQQDTLGLETGLVAIPVTFKVATVRPTLDTLNANTNTAEDTNSNTNTSDPTGSSGY